MIVEGVEYHRYVIRFVWANGKRARWVRWAPAVVYMRESLMREWDDMDLEVTDIKAGSVQIVLADEVSTV